MKTTQKFFRSLIFSAVFASVNFSVSGAQLAGLSVGEKAPEFALRNQDGEVVKLDELRKTGPVALVFFRSADW